MKTPHNIVIPTSIKARVPAGLSLTDVYNKAAQAHLNGSLSLVKPEREDRYKTTILSEPETILGVNRLATQADMSVNESVRQMLDNYLTSIGA